jgi:hypothetical protein
VNKITEVYVIQLLMRSIIPINLIKDRNWELLRAERVFCTTSAKTFRNPINFDILLTWIML